MRRYFCVGFIDFMLAGKKLTVYTIFFFTRFKKKTMTSFCLISNINQSNSIEAIEKTKLTEQRKFWLDEISRIENYFHEEINQRTSCSKKISKYVAAFDYIDKILIVLNATNGGVSICSFTSIADAPVGIASARFTLIFSLTTEITKKLLSTTRKKK